MPPHRSLAQPRRKIPAIVLALTLASGCGHLGIEFGGDSVALDGSGGESSAPGTGSSGSASAVGGALPSGSGGEVATAGDSGSGGDSFATGGASSGGATGDGGGWQGTGSSGGGDWRRGWNNPWTWRAPWECNSGPFTWVAMLENLGDFEAEKLAPSVTRDGLSLYFSVRTADDEKIYRATRPDRDSDFGLASPVEDVDDPLFREVTPYVNEGEDRLYFARQAGDDESTLDLFVAERPLLSTSFQPAIRLDVSSQGPDFLPWVDDDEIAIYFTSDRAGSPTNRIYRATRMLVTESFGEVTTFAAFAGDAHAGSPSITADWLTLYLTSNRNGDYDVYASGRPAFPSEEYSEPVALEDPGINTTFDEKHARLSPDGKELYFTSDRTTKTEIWMARRNCD